MCNSDESHIPAPIVCPNGDTFHLDVRRVYAWCLNTCKLRIPELCQHHVHAYGLISDKVYSSILEHSVVQILVFQACLMSLYLHFIVFDFLFVTEFSSGRTDKTHLMSKLCRVVRIRRHMTHIFYVIPLFFDFLYVITV